MTKIQLIAEDIDRDNFDDSKLPSDVHIVTFTLDGARQHDAVRGYTKVDIFDEYYDKVRGKGEILAIESGFGKIRPNLYGKIAAKDED